MLWLTSINDEQFDTGLQLREGKYNWIGHQDEGPMTQLKLHTKLGQIIRERERN
jgi:hypothetical protein